MSRLIGVTLATAAAMLVLAGGLDGAGERALVPVPTCAPSPELADAVPALRRGEWIMVPEAERTMPSGGRRQWVRRLEGDGLDLRVVSRCEDADRACVLATHEGRWTAQPCGTAAEVRGGGSYWTHPVIGTDRLGVTGLAPPGSRVAVVRLDGTPLHEIAVTEGVFGGILPASFGSSVDQGEREGDIDVQFRSR